jgi:hypothetical protein
MSYRLAVQYRSARWRIIKHKNTHVPRTYHLPAEMSTVKWLRQMVHAIVWYVGAESTSKHHVARKQPCLRLIWLCLPHVVHSLSSLATL